MVKLYQVNCSKCNNKTVFYLIIGKILMDTGNTGVRNASTSGSWISQNAFILGQKSNLQESCLPASRQRPLQQLYFLLQECYHSVFALNPTAISAPSMSKLFDKNNL